MTRRRVLALQILLLLAVFVIWDVLTRTGILAPFFFGEPLVVLQRI